MSVLDQRYRRWDGEPTPYWRRMLVIPRYDLREVFSRKAWAAFYIVSLGPPLVLGAWVYAAANLAQFAKLVPILAQVRLPFPGPDSWAAFTFAQLWLIFAFSLLVGPPLATRDFANNAMPLYLSKALGRWEYVLGRWAILLGLLSAASWVPLALIFGLECALAPATWRAENAWILGGIFAATIPAVLLLTALNSAIAAHVHRSNAARAALLAIVMLSHPMAAALEKATRTPLAQCVSPMAMAVRINAWAFEPPAAPAADRPLVGEDAPPRRRRDTTVPVPLAFLVLAAWLGGCVAVLAARVRPVEVVK